MRKYFQIRTLNNKHLHDLINVASYYLLLIVKLIKKILFFTQGRNSMQGRTHIFATFSIDLIPQI